MRRGFTLIELLVVIAIIAILAAILFPVFAKAREKARQTSCLNNVKQLTLAILQYTQDYDEVLPLAGYWPLNPTYHVAPYWDELLLPYIKNTQIYRCPSAAAGTRNYRYNPPRGGARGAAPACTKLGTIDAPASVVLLTDIAQAGYLNTTGSYDLMNDGYIVEVHNGGANLGFADGHAKWVKAPSAYYTYGWLAASGYTL
jgi:prepilin-type N-terminal cleavage/methylation domain-containing protein/prepilin-type processing-associated H-X9-DG protein